MSLPPSVDGAETIRLRAIAKALDEGQTLLAARAIGQIAWHVTGYCWLSARKLCEAIERATGRRYHWKSVSRILRLLDKNGRIKKTRCMPLSIPEGADHPSTYGTTSSRIVWGTWMRNPRGSFERTSRKKQREAKLEAKREQERAQKRAQELYGVEPPERTKNATPDRKIAAMVAGIGQAGPAPSPRRWSPLDPPPKPETSTKESADDAKRRLFEAFPPSREPDKPPD